MEVGRENCDFRQWADRTPVLKGKDAKNFLSNMKIEDKDKPSQAQISKMQENFRKLNSIAQR